MFEISDDYTPRPPRVKPVAPDTLSEQIIFYVLGISALSLGGVACRMALLECVSDNYFFQSSTVVTANAIGSFIMGILFGCIEYSKQFPYTFFGLTVGFCGSFTTFSSWMNSVVNDSEPVVQCFTGLTIPFTVFIVGADIGSSFSVPKFLPVTARGIDRGIVSCLALVGVLVMVAIAATIDPGATISNGDLISVGLGPIGALMRFGLSRWLNPVWPNQFMLGTFVANMVAVIVTGGLTHCANGDNWCDYTETGICGSLSSVSSWVLDTVQIYKKSRPWAYFYCLFSVGVGIAIMIPFKQ